MSSSSSLSTSPISVSLSLFIIISLYLYFSLCYCDEACDEIIFILFFISNICLLYALFISLLSKIIFELISSRKFLVNYLKVFSLYCKFSAACLEKLLRKSLTGGCKVCLSYCKSSAEYLLRKSSITTTVIISL